VINIAAMRIFYFPPAKPGEKQVVYTHPIGIGKVGWSTPEGKTKVLSKQKDPPGLRPHRCARSTRRTARSCPGRAAGPDNPLGRSSSRWAGRLPDPRHQQALWRRAALQPRLHPAVSRRRRKAVRHGGPWNHGAGGQPAIRVRLARGAAVPAGLRRLEDDKRDWSKSQPKLLSKTLSKRIQGELTSRKASIDWERVAESPPIPRGLALSVSAVDQSVAALIRKRPGSRTGYPMAPTGMGRMIPPCRPDDVKVMVTEQQQAPRS
jgi:L,D-transpeptidase ErfK/SrfK